MKTITLKFNLSGFNSPQLAAICFKGERSEGKNRVIQRWPRLFEQQSQFYKCMPALGLSCHG